MNRKRVNKFHGNVAPWLNLAEVDYFIHFVKAWIPFNAWFSTTYSTENQDREIINRIKHETNPFRDKIINYLTKNDPESQEFIKGIGKLHLALEKNIIPSQEYKISLTNVIISKNTLSDFSVVVNGHNIKVTYNHSAQKGAQKINIKVIELKGYSPKMDWSQNDWDIEELKGNYDFKKIGKSTIRIKIQNAILKCYEEINPYKPTSLILPPKTKGKAILQYLAPENCIRVDTYKHVYLIDEPETIAKGLIEILYNLRNCLFHGEINPSVEIQTIYREAYFILNSIIKSL